MIIGISGKIGSGKDTVAKMIQFLALQEQADQDWHYYNNFIKYDKDNRHSHVYDTKWRVKRFADKLKDIVCLLIGCSREQLEDREFKEKPLGEEWKKYILRVDTDAEDLVSATPFSENEIKTYGLRMNQVSNPRVIEEILTPRKLMQLLGTEAGRKIIHPDIWVNTTMADYNKGTRVYAENAHHKIDTFDKWIIPDTRFPNEANAIKDRSGVVIKVHRNIDLRLPELWKEFEYEGSQVAQVRNAFYGFLQDNYPKEYKKHTHPSEIGLDSYSDWDYTITNNGTISTLFEIVKNIYEEIHEKDND